jgi:hypothetical protein
MERRRQRPSQLQQDRRSRGAAAWWYRCPIAAARTAATSGLSKLTSAFINRACGDYPSPEDSSETPRCRCGRRTNVPRRASGRHARSRHRRFVEYPARATYMADVIAFRLVERFSWTRQMPPERSVTISSIVKMPGPPAEFRCTSRGEAAPSAANVVTLGRMLPSSRNGAAFMQTIDFGRAESELPENLVVVFANLWGALRGHFGDAMHLKRAADGGR